MSELEVGLTQDDLNMSSLTRDDLLQALRAALEPHDWVQAAWVGGSDAFGRADALSDVDLQLLVVPEDGDRAFALVESVVEALGGARHVWRVPEPAWHGLRQRFYQLSALPETCMLDLCVARADRLAPFLDPVRHGLPVIWFDRVGAVVPVPDPTLAATFDRRLEQLVARAHLLAHMPEKALARGRPIEAVDGLQRLLLAPLIELLRRRYAPDRQDYGLRYLPEDLPAEVVARLEPLFFAADSADLAGKISLARAWLTEELGRAEYTGAGGGA